MQDQPSAPELLDAVAGLLFTQVREWVPNERRFQVLVAANVCAVVARELREGPEASLADVRLFRDLIGASGPDPAPEEAEAEAREAAVELAWLIRRGELDQRLGEAISRLREHVRRKLDIARPGYARDD